jgi:CBS domain-containing protein
MRIQSVGVRRVDMKTIGQLLREKARPALSIAPESSVLEALKLMAKHDVGALLVMQGERLVGIFSERDYARKVILKGKSSSNLPVSEIMTDKVIYTQIDQTVSQALAIVTEKHIRHLPVLDSNQRVLGVVSIGDLVKETIADQIFTIQQLVHYIAR